MAKQVVMDAFQIIILVPVNLTTAETGRIRRTLNNKSFAQHLRRAVAGICRNHPSLSAVSVRISQ